MIRSTLFLALAASLAAGAAHAETWVCLIEGGEVLIADQRLVFRETSGNEDYLTVFTCDNDGCVAELEPITAGRGFFVMQIERNANGVPIQSRHMIFVADPEGVVEVSSHMDEPQELFGCVTPGTD
ncbi:hypothetical protein HKCCSP123_06255 [Rhodobacterales bacterium HKCCSP123]|nr:hypothetical protein [Rhodobacterales bacterium HKCCSP123]